MFIGCLAKGDKPQVLESRFGIPENLTRILEDFFECISSGSDQKGVDFFRAIPDAIGHDGKDLSKAVTAFITNELKVLNSIHIEDAGIEMEDVDSVIKILNGFMKGHDVIDAKNELIEIIETRNKSLPKYRYTNIVQDALTRILDDLPFHSLNSAFITMSHLELISPSKFSILYQSERLLQVIRDTK